MFLNATSKAINIIITTAIIPYNIKPLVVDLSFASPNSSYKALSLVLSTILESIDFAESSVNNSSSLYISNESVSALYTETNPLSFALLESSLAELLIAFVAVSTRTSS